MMTPEEILEEILLLSEEQRALLFALARERPSLREAWEKSARPVGGPVPTRGAGTAPIRSNADYLIIWDGGSRGNPGQGYGSYQLTAVRSRKSRTESVEFEGVMTNNEAEYETLIHALSTLATKIRERGKDPKQYSLDVRGDSMLVINQVTGKWKAKDQRMASYRDRVRELLSEFASYTLTHHDRSYSVAALGH